VVGAIHAEGMRSARCPGKMIRLVKKIKVNGQTCSKCKDVEERLHKAGYMKYIDQIIVADESDPDSEGMQLAKTHQVDRAPFFIVEEGDATRIYTVYFQFVKEVLQGFVPSNQEAQDMLHLHQSLDLL